MWISNWVKLETSCRMKDLDRLPTCHLRPSAVVPTDKLTVAYAEMQELNPTPCIHIKEDAGSRSTSVDLKSSCHGEGNPTLRSFFLLWLLSGRLCMSQVSLHVSVLFDNAFAFFFFFFPRKVCAWLMFMNCLHKTSMLNSACIAYSRYAHKKQQPQMHGLLIEIQESSLAAPLVLESVDSDTCKCTWAASAALELLSLCSSLWLCVTCRQCNTKQLPYHYILPVSEKQPVTASVLNYRPHKIVHVSALPRASDPVTAHVWARVLKTTLWARS